MKHITYTLPDGRRVTVQRLPSGRYRMPSAHGDYVIVNVSPEAWPAGFQRRWHRAAPWRVDVPYATRSVSYYPTLRMAIAAVEAERIHNGRHQREAVEASKRAYSESLSAGRCESEALEVAARVEAERYRAKPLAMAGGEWPVYVDVEARALSEAGTAPARKDG